MLEVERVDDEHLLYYGGDLYEGEDEGGSSSDDGSNTCDSSGSDSEDDSEPEPQPEEPEDDSSNEGSSERDSGGDEDDDLCEHCNQFGGCPLGAAVVHNRVRHACFDHEFVIDTTLCVSLRDGTELRNVVHVECYHIEYLVTFPDPGPDCLEWSLWDEGSDVGDKSGPQIVYSRENKEDGFVLRPDIVITLLFDDINEIDCLIAVERPVGEYGVEAMPLNTIIYENNTVEERRLVFCAGDIEEEDWDGDDKLGQIQNSTLFRLTAKRLDMPLRRAMRQWLENRHNPRHPAGQAYIGGLYDSTMAEQEVADAGTPSPPAAAAAAAAPPYEDCPCDTGKPCYICYCDAKAGVCQCICAQCNSSHGTDWVGCEDCDTSWCNQCGRVTMAPQTSDSL